MTIWHAILLFGAAFLGGALNSVAGGGSFLTFPTLIFTGVPSINANATSTVALWPGSAASVGAYRAELRIERHLVVMGAVSIAGGLFGAFVLLRTPPVTFDRLIPFLLLLATLLFTFSGAVTARLRRFMAHKHETSLGALVGVAAVQLVIATYGGFFGGGIGILMLAALALMGMEDIHEMNAVKTLLASCINGVAVVAFLVARAVVWPQVGIMVAGGILGGYVGASTARQINPIYVRRVVVVVGFLLTAYFFIR